MNRSLVTSIFRTLVLAFGACMASPGFAALELPDLFADHMVLQRDQPVPIWGRAQPGSEITVVFAAQRKQTAADPSGRWRVALDPLPASAQARMLEVTSSLDSTTRRLEDVLVGEVWLCSGQSNMAMTVDGPTQWLHVGGVANAKEEVLQSANPLLRHFYVDWKTHTRPQETCSGSWTIAGPTTTARFSATGYFFAREIQRRLQVPVAILNASWGGSSVESWISREAQSVNADPATAARIDQIFDDFDHHEQRLQTYADALAAWEKKHGRAHPSPQEGPPDSTRPGEPVQLPAPLAKLGCPDGGVVWLQREVHVPEAWGSAWRLDFPPCKAFHAVFVNGVKIQEATPANGLADRASRPTLPAKLGKPGVNKIAIQLHAYSGKAGILPGPFALIPFNPKFTPIPLAGEWALHRHAVFAALPPGADPPPPAPVKPVLHWLGVPAQYNAMLHPLIPYGIRGVAWYQGESNVGKSDYGSQLHRLIRDWRQRWGQGDFPFLVCQLPGFGPPSPGTGNSAWAACREAQFGVLDLPNTGVANLLDTCEDGDLHPLNKQDPGRRLAGVALAQVYGFSDVVSSGPVFASWSVQGGEAVVRFKHTHGGLKAGRVAKEYRPNLRKPELPPKPLELPSPESVLQGFDLCEMRAQADGSHAPHWEHARARIEGDTVVVWSPQITRPEAVRYAWADHPVCNLENGAGLPAFAFRTDAFPLPQTQKP